MAKDRVITVLQKDGYIVAPFTNNLAAYNHFLKQLPEHEQTLQVSYSTVHRIVKNAGDTKAINTSLGVFQFRKMVLHKKHF